MTMEGFEVDLYKQSIFLIIYLQFFVKLFYSKILIGCLVFASSCLVLVFFFCLLDLLGLSWMCVVNLLSLDGFIADWQASFSMNDISSSEL